MTHSLDSLNRASKQFFIRQLAGIYEHSSWVAECAADKRAFVDLPTLHLAMSQCVQAASRQQQLQLICAHPQLAGRAALRGELTAHSRQEQSGAGLDQCNEEEFAAINSLNQQYQDRFGFPFIIAVKTHTRASIIDAMRSRLGHSVQVEFEEALKQIDLIAWHRLSAMIHPSLAASSC